MSSDPSCQPSTPTETLYSALEGEIDIFVGHVQQCQHCFDLHALYKVLLVVLLHSPLGWLDSWEDLELLSKHLLGSPSPSVCGYVDCLGSYLQHLQALKERFDTRVVFLLCEHLYVREELLPLASIPHLAALLFAHRHNWALLLRGAMLHERVFSPNSLCDLTGFANAGPVEKVLQLLLDIYQGLIMASLPSRGSVCTKAGTASAHLQAPYSQAVRSPSPQTLSSQCSSGEREAVLGHCGSGCGRVRRSCWSCCPVPSKQPPCTLRSTASPGASVPCTCSCSARGWSPGMRDVGVYTSSCPDGGAAEAPGAGGVPPQHPGSRLAAGAGGRARPYPQDQCSKWCGLALCECSCPDCLTVLHVQEPSTPSASFCRFSAASTWRRCCCAGSWLSHRGSSPGAG